MRAIVLVLVLQQLVSGQTGACEQRSNPVENAICRIPRLQVLSAEVTRLYDDTMKRGVEIAGCESATTHQRTNCDLYVRYMHDQWIAENAKCPAETLDACL